MYDLDRGYVCTLSALVVKSATVHVFHVGDRRVYRLDGGAFEQLTNDLRIHIAGDRSYLSSALGAEEHVEIEYRALGVEAGDVFVLCTDGVHEHVADSFIAATIREHGDDLDAAAKAIVAGAYARGSTDNLTVQIARIDGVPRPDGVELYRHLAELPPALAARAVVDGYRIIRELHRNVSTYSQHIGAFFYITTSGSSVLTGVGEICNASGVSSSAAAV